MSAYSVLSGPRLKMAGTALLASEARNKSTFYWLSGLINIQNQHTRELISARNTSHEHDNKDPSRLRCVCVCVCVSACACVSVCLCVCVRVSV